MKFVPSTRLREALQEAPFNLDGDQLDWVYKTFDRLAPRERLSQLFNVLLTPEAARDPKALATFQPGGVTFPLSIERDDILGTSRLLAHAAVPVLVSADLEGGAIQMKCMAPCINPMGIAAAGSTDLYKRAVNLLAQESIALGINWAFAPVVDINAEFRSAIVATRSFGQDPSLITAMANIYVEAMQSRGVAATAKHWPGDGYDARDQHLVTTVNPLSVTEWQESFGKIYGSLIAKGVVSVMSAHIAFPAYATAHGVDGLEAYRPASISWLLNRQLLRGELGFNGLIISDASSMGGLTSWGTRAEILPQAIENGCDMILFSHDWEADLQILERALVDGRLSQHRLEESVLRILALKATLGLNASAPEREAKDESKEMLASSGAREVEAEIAAACPTLVKDVRGILPIAPSKYRRIAVVTDPARSGFGDLPPAPLVIDQLLEQEGFEVAAYDQENPPSVGEVDLIIYLLAQESLLTKSHIYLNWVSMLGPMEKAMARLWHEIPTVLVSFGQPYYLYDAPRMPCVINAYSALESIQKAVVRKMLGREQFVGRSPVDAFCGLIDAKY